MTTLMLGFSGNIRPRTISAERAEWLIGTRKALSTKAEGSTVSKHYAFVTAASYTADGRRLILAVHVNIYICDAESLRRTEPPLGGHTEPVTCIAVARQGDIFASGSEDMTIRIWSVSSLQTLCVLEGHTQPITSIAFSPDGGRLTSGSCPRGWESTEGEVAVWSVQSSE